MKIVYFGTPYFAAQVLSHLIDSGIAISAVITQPDRPKGRKLQLSPSPVKAIALAHNISVLQPEKASAPSFLDEIKSVQADLFVVVAFGQILSQKLLDTPPKGCINVHTSLLPKYRGAAPIQRAIMAGETETGVAIQKMVKQLDAGDVIASRAVPIGGNMTFAELEEKLIECTKPMLVSVIKSFEVQIPHASPQIHEEATYASKIEMTEGEIDWQKPALTLHNLIRAFSPRPGAWCTIEIAGVKKRLKILRTERVDLQGSAGKILSAAPVIACGDGALKLLEVQPEGKKAMQGADWFRGCSSNSISFI